jgi:hypothetical protein
MGGKMSYATDMTRAQVRQTNEQTGARYFSAVPDSANREEGKHCWATLWSEAFLTQHFSIRTQNSAPLLVSIAIEGLTTAMTQVNINIEAMMSSLEKLFGNSATDLAKILRVSRPMIYHYRKGIEPSTENRRRLQTLVDLAGDYPLGVTQPLKKHLRTRQPEGRTLLDFLSDEELNTEALRLMLQRVVKSSDATLRNRLAHELARQENNKERKDILRARHAEGKPVYIGDPDTPGKLIQVRPDGQRIRGRMVNRQFVPDSE